MHGFGVDTCANAGQNVVSHCFAGGLAAHSVEVVEEVVHDRRVAAVFFAPQRAVLIHRCQLDGFPYRATAQGCVTDVGHHDAGLAVNALVERCARGNGCRAANNGVVRHGTERLEEGMHRAAHAAVEACLTGEDLRQRAEQDEVFGQLTQVLVPDFFGQSQRFTVEEALHNCFQISVLVLACS